MTSYKKLNEAALCKDNNLNAVKFIAAIMVIVSHAYAFAGNYAKTDWFSYLTRQKGDLGGLAVSVFFFYSGLLITMSLFRNPDLKRYVKRRAVRIYPAFFTVTILIVFVAAPFITNLSVKDYFLNSQTYAYLKNLVFITEHNLPGVFTSNIYGRSVNGPIWTVRVEAACYVLCYVFYRLRLLEVKKILPLTALYLLILGITGVIYMLGMTDIYAVVMPFTMFFIGMVYAVYSENIKLNSKQLAAAAVGFIIFCILGQVILASIVFLPIILCNLAFGGRGNFEILDALGKYSYEIYLWGGFVGQTVSYMFGGSMNEYLNMLITIPVTIILAYFTNKAVGTENGAK